MKIAVVDDERPARGELIWILKQCEPEAEIKEAASSSQLLELLETEDFDACFVDINLGGTNGTTLASMILARQPHTAIVFATAYQEYAVKAFDLGAVDYLTKPFDLERVRKTMDRLRGICVANAAKAAVKEAAQGKIAEDKRDLESQTKEAGEQKASSRSDQNSLVRIMVTTANGYQAIDVRDIIYIETENRSSLIHTRKGDFAQNESLNSYENKLDGQRFFRIHKSYLINLDEVAEMVRSYNNGYGVRLRGCKDLILPLGRTQLKEFRQKFGV